MQFDNFQNIFTKCRLILGHKSWARVLAALDEDFSPQYFGDMLQSLKNTMELPGYIADLANLEYAFHKTKKESWPPRQPIQTTRANPSLTLISVSWNGLPIFFQEAGEVTVPSPALCPSHIMVWRHPKTGTVHVKQAEDIDLLALKLILEDIPPHEAAAMGDVAVKTIGGVINRGIAKGLLVSPDSRLKRSNGSKPEMHGEMSDYVTADVFTLQWHITQVCDLHCKHCYDRSDRKPLTFESAVAILDDLKDFCDHMHVKGQVSLTGGNPLLHPHFMEIYKEAKDRGFDIGILGNPTPVDQIEKLLKIAKPEFFQISLEGLAEHNDDIRGKGHFQKSMAFLDQLRQLDIYTMVMLTLTRSNLNQVLPLGFLLKDRTDYFTFSRLSTVGEGAQLLMPEKKEFETFLRKYEAASTEHPIFGLKDNLINIIRKEKNKSPFGGCTGFGCGAAFNFVAVLADGEVHACRKFPSLIGNISESTLFDIYHSKSGRIVSKRKSSLSKLQPNQRLQGMPCRHLQPWSQYFQE